MFVLICVSIAGTMCISLLMQSILKSGIKEGRDDQRLQHLSYYIFTIHSALGSWPLGFWPAFRVVVLKSWRTGLRFKTVAYSTERASVSSWRAHRGAFTDFSTYLRLAVKEPNEEPPFQQMKTLDKALLCCRGFSVIFCPCSPILQALCYQGVRWKTELFLCCTVCHPHLSTMWEMLQHFKKSLLTDVLSSLATLSKKERKN